MARSTPVGTRRRAVALRLGAALVLASAAVLGASAGPATSAPAATSSAGVAAGSVRFAPVSMTPAAVTGPVTAAGSGAVMGANSNNWAGWAASGNRYTSVSASWTQPSVQCASHENSDSAFWVGLDGYNSGSVEQAGVQAGCANGNAFYGAWTELFPSPPQFLSQSVNPGDALTVTVTLTGGRYSLTIGDAHHWSATSSGKTQRSSSVSAEVVAEAPTGSKGVMQLSNFRSVSFASAAVNGKSMSQANRLAQITMGSSRRVMAQPSGLSGSSFGVSWKSASG
jgi:hypothetical protein